MYKFYDKDIYRVVRSNLPNLKNYKHQGLSGYGNKAVLLYKAVGQIKNGPS